MTDNASNWVVTQTVTTAAYKGYYKNSSGVLVSFDSGGTYGPNPDTLSPSVVQQTAGQTTSPVTFTGQGFGTNQPTVIASGGTITITPYGTITDGMFNATVVVPPNTPAETVTVIVTSTGYSQSGGSGFFGGGGGQSPTSAPSPPASVVIPCPTGITFNSAGSFYYPTVQQVFPGDKSGAGLIAQMDVTGPLSNYNGAQITEVLTPGTNSCPSPTPACGTATTFTVGNGNPSTSPIGNQQATLNAFWDNNVYFNTASLLPAGASCQVVCTQQFTCKGNPLGNKFTITKNFSASTYQNTPVTNVSATKQ